MRLLSKSKLISFRQCAKRLWLELKRPDLAEVSASAEARFEVGHTVGAVARRLYDPEQTGTLVDAKTEGFEAALKRSVDLLSTRAPLFEAGYSADGALAFADVMMPVGNGSRPAWRMIEVKSATSVKDYHRDDAAIQAFVARRAGVPLEGIAVAHIDSAWTYPGGGNYAGLLAEYDLTEETREREGEVAEWIKQARAVSELRDEPKINTGTHCTDPFECPFAHYCAGQEPQAEYPVAWLPRLTSKEAKAAIETKAVTDLRQMPDALLNDLQRRVKQHTLSGQPYFDKAGAAAELAGYGPPVAFLDFETITFAVPVWAGTRPYQQIPFQFSLHRLSATGELEHDAFLDVSGADPSRPFAETLIGKCSGPGAVFVYNVGFERSRVMDLARRFPDLAGPLEALAARLVDLLPVAQRHFYHPSQHGSWSIKQVLPAMAPELDYGALDGVKDGNAAMDAYREAIAPQTTAGRRAEIRQQLLRYCALDTYALVRVWQQLSGQTAVIPAK